MLHDLLSALPTVATSPLALAGYLVLILAWVVVSLSFRRTNRLFGAIKALPEEERLKAITLEYRATPSRGLTAKEWLDARKSSYLFIGYGGTLFTAVILFILSGRQAELNEYWKITDARAEAAVQLLKLDAMRDPKNKHQIDALRQDIDNLNKKRLAAIKNGDLILAQDLANQRNLRYADAIDQGVINRSQRALLPPKLQ